jgi:hypothetical protein
VRPSITVKIHPEARRILFIPVLPLAVSNIIVTKVRKLVNTTVADKKPGKTYASSENISVSLQGCVPIPFHLIYSELNNRRGER